MDLTNALLNRPKAQALEFQPGSWYAVPSQASGDSESFDSEDSADYVAMYCAKVAPSGLGILVPRATSMSGAQWWNPENALYISDERKVNEMTIRKNELSRPIAAELRETYDRTDDWPKILTQPEREATARATAQATAQANIGMAIAGLSLTEPDALENSNDDWGADPVAHALGLVQTKLIEQEEKLYSAEAQVDQMQQQLGNVRAELSNEKLRRADLEGRLAGLAARPVYGDSPLLWDRITGAGPFIQVPYTDSHCLERGQTSVYAGGMLSGGVKQARKLVWLEAMTTRPPKKTASLTTIALFTIGVWSAITLAAYGVTLLIM